MWQHDISARFHEHKFSLWTLWHFKPISSYEIRKVDEHRSHRNSLTHGLFLFPGEMWLQDRKFFCVTCSKSFTQKHHLTVHMKNLHGELKGPFRCCFCNKMSKNSESLRKHISHKHAWSRSSKVKNASFGNLTY